MEFIYTFISIYILVVYVWAYIDLFKSSAPDGIKILFVVLFLLFTIIGVIIWLFFRKEYANNLS